MVLWSMLLACLFMMLPGGVAAAGPVDGNDNSSGSQPPGGSGAALAEPLRELLMRNLPTPLYEANPGWGHTAKTTTRVHWTGSGLHVHPHAKKDERNDGVWRKVRVTAENLPRSLILELRNIQHPEPGRTSFEVLLAFDARVEYEQQKWKAGVRLYSGSARARLRVQLALDCELITRLEWGSKIAPEAVFRLHVVRSNLSYSHVVVEHIAGVGGEAAKLIGEAIERGMHQWRPSLERNLLLKANAAIEKAADTKEVRIGLGSLRK
jgi:hypothetical protein